MNVIKEHMHMHINKLLFNNGSYDKNLCNMKFNIPRTSL